MLQFSMKSTLKGLCDARQQQLKKELHSGAKKVLFNGQKALTKTMAIHQEKPLGVTRGQFPRQPRD